ncbi:MAG: nucleoside triphosphate pyrophosphohydrolase [Ignavibacteriaceae bacterium]|nr:nucleoside triphosphate pyrophosphohydrolase [Ignavibacteriaceae bacterium]
MSKYDFNELRGIVERLRKECPWDREQSNDSIKAATIEEAYEVVHAIDEKDWPELKKELGDLLLHVVFHSVIAAEDKHFTLDDVIQSISEKLIRRHPHVFGEVSAEDSETVKKNWEAIKLSEGRKSVTEGIPSSLPSLLRAYRIQEKVAKVGFDWTDIRDVKKKVDEEIDELAEAVHHDDHGKIEEEFGDLLFALTNYARFLKINPEDALRKANIKFEKRFRYVESRFEEQNKKIYESTLEEMDIYWEEGKRKGL